VVYRADGSAANSEEPRQAGEMGQEESREVQMRAARSPAHLEE